MNRVLAISSIAIAGTAIGVAAVFVGIDCDIKDQSRPSGKDTERDRKKSASALRIAKKVCKMAPPQVVVLAPRRVSKQLSSLPNCPAPLFVGATSQKIPDTDKEKRRALVRHIEFKEDISFADTRGFVDDLRRYGIRLVVTSSEGIRNRRVKDILRQIGYDKVELIEDNHIWIQKLDWRKVDERDRYQAEQVCRTVPKGSYVLAPLGVSVHLEKIGCCRPFLYNPPEAFTDPSFKRRLDFLDNLLSVDKDFFSVEAAILREVLESQLISAVVLIQHGDGNKDLKDELRRHNFKMATKSDYFRLWIPKDGPASGSSP